MDMSLNLNILVTLICWGLWGIADKKALQAAKQFDVILCLYMCTVALVPFVGAVLLFSNPGWRPDGQVLFWTGCAACTYLGAMFAYIEAMKRTEASYVLGITASYPLILQFLATMFLNEALVPERLLGSVIIASGLILIGGSTEKAPRSSEQSDKGRLLVWLLVAIATLCWGVYGLFDKKALATGAPFEVYVIQRVWDVVALAVLFMIARVGRITIQLRQKMTWLYCGLSALALATGGFCYLQALSMASASYVITITGCYPLLMYFFAIAFLGEKFNLVRFCGILLIVAGGLTVQLTQS